MTLGISEPMDFSPDQNHELDSIASEFNLILRRATSNPTRDEWVQFVKECNYVISGKQGLSTTDPSGAAGTEGIYDAPRGIVISHPFVNVGWVDTQRLKKLNISLLYAPGCNRDAVAEWVLGYALTLFRNFRVCVNKREMEPRVNRSQSLAGKAVAILGKGAVGTRCGEVLGALKMDVRYLVRGGSLLETVCDVDLVVNCLSSKAENRNLLNADFFLNQMSRGSTFVSMTNPAIYDIDGLLAAMKNGHIHGAAIDVGNTFPGDVHQDNYKKFTSFLNLHPEFENVLLVTPQVAHFSNASQRSSFDMAIENIRRAVNNTLNQIPDRMC